MKGKKYLCMGLLLSLGMTGLFGRAGNAAGVSEELLGNPVYEEKADQAAWDCVYYGSYPQSEVTDEALLAELAALPEDSYNKAGDVVLGNMKYRRISKKTALNTDTADGYYDWSRGGGAGGYHYFVYEPIVWRVLRVDGRGMLLLADTCLEDKKYHNRDEEVTWKGSSLRSWLNGYGAKENIGGYSYSDGNAFVNFAFTDEEQKKLLSYEAASSDNSYYGTGDGQSTKDKVFLLSVEDMSENSYGFSGKAAASHTRVMECSDYAWARGLYTDTSKEKRAVWWWLRTAGEVQDEASGVVADGYILYNVSEPVNSVENGVCPAIYLSLDADWKPAGRRISVPEAKEQLPASPAPSAGSENTAASPAPGVEPGGGGEVSPTDIPEQTSEPAEDEWQENRKVRKVQVTYQNKKTACATWKKSPGATGYKVKLTTNKNRRKKTWVCSVAANRCLLPCKLGRRYVVRVYAYKKENHTISYGRTSDKVVYWHRSPNIL